MTARQEIAAIQGRLVKLEFVEGRDVWERQPRETKSRYYMFSVYRDLLPHDRSLNAAARKLNRSRDHLADICRICRWVERCEAWDAFNEQQRTLQLRQLIREDVVRVNRMRGMLLAGLEKRLSGHDLEQIQAVDWNKISTSDLIKGFEVLAKLARMADQDDQGIRDTEGITVNVAFPFNPQYDSDPQAADVELPPSGFRELDSEPETE